MPRSGMAVYYVDELTKRLPIELVKADGLVHKNTLDWLTGISDGISWIVDKK